MYGFYQSISGNLQHVVNRLIVNSEVFRQLQSVTTKKSGLISRF